MRNTPFSSSILATMSSLVTEPASVDLTSSSARVEGVSNRLKTSLYSAERTTLRVLPTALTISSGVAPSLKWVATPRTTDLGTQSTLLRKSKVPAGLS